MNSRKSILAALAVILGLAMVISGCAGSKPPIMIALGPSGAQNAVAGQVVSITATVTNDSKTAGVTWSLTGPGTLSSQTSTSVTYTAPSPVTANATATITATSVSDTSRTTTLMINLQAVSIAFAPSAAQTDEQGQTTSVNATVSNDPKTKGVTWSLTGAGALSGQTATAVTYTAPASITTASTATITATSVFDNTKTSTLTVNLVPPPSVTTTSLAAGTVATAYSATLAATNGVSPYTWSVTVGALPTGLTLAAGTGAITGTPTAYGTSNFTVQVKDANNFTAIAALSIKISPAPVVITTTSLPNGVVNSAGYSATLASTGGATPITWSWTAQAGSTLPPGLVIAPSTGVISGTPTSAGTFNVSVTATDSSTPALSASKNFSITIIPQLAITTTSPLPNGITTTAYTGVTLASTGGSGAVVWSLTGGTTLPANLSLNASTGAITGTPTTAGTFGFTVQAADSGTPQQKVTKVFSITIIQQLVVTTSAALRTGSVTTPYTVTLASSGGTGAVTWALANGSTLPGGLTLTSAGVLAGTPTTAGTFNFSITATDSGVPPQTATVAFTLTITPKLAITTPSLPSGTLGTAYSATVQTNNGGIVPYTWSWIAQAGSSLPPGLSIAPGTGVISGTPTSAGTFNVTINVADSSTPTAQTASANFTISIATAPLSVATTGLPNGVMGQAYTGAVLQSAGGNPPVTWSISAGALPTWATLAPSTGAITGTPNATGTTNFTVKATDSTTPTAQTATKALSITVISALSITTTQAQIPAGVVGNPYNAAIAATGGTTPYAWSWTAQAGSSLPPGLGINPGTGAITGTVGGSGGTYNVTVSVADSGAPQQNASANFSITITVATLTVTTTSGSLPTGTINTAYPNTNVSASGGIPPYSWSLTGGTNLPAGLSLSSSGQITGTPTATGTTNFTVQVSDSATPTANTATMGLSITVNAAPTCVAGGSESLLNGQYAFVLKGFDSAGNPAIIGGVLTFNGTNNSGLITAGTIDINQNSGFTTNAVTSGSYGVTSDHRGCMVITTSAGTQNYRFSLGNISSGVASTGHVIDFDSTGPFTAGVMRKQTASAFSTSQVTGNYAFGVSSAQNAANCVNTICGGAFGAVGMFNFSSGSVTGGVVDFSNNGQLDNTTSSAWPSSPVSISNGGSYTISGTTGRGTLSFTPVTSGATTVDTIIYVVTATDVLVLSSDSQANNSLFAGELLKQSGSLSGNPLSGAYVGYQSGLGSTVGTSRTTLLLLTASGTGITGTQLRNDGGSFQSKSLTGITYSVASSGRMTVTGGTNPPIFYLVSANEAFALNGDTTVAAGFFQSQTGSPFSNSSASGTYAFGTIDPQDANSGDSLGVATFTPATTSISVINDNNSNGSQTLDQTQSMTYSIDTTGLVSIPSGCSISATPTTCQAVLYIISPTKAVLMDATSGNPKIQVADQ
jgi:putative Ig domain-containing protein